MDAYDCIADLLAEMGEFACEAQADILRSYKDDGSVLTETDTVINERVGDAIARLFPEANVITEEAVRPYDPAAPLTFVVIGIAGIAVVGSYLGFPAEEPWQWVRTAWLVILEIGIGVGGGAIIGTLFWTMEAER